MNEKIRKFGTDKYFLRSKETLEHQLEKRELDPEMEIVAEITVSLPKEYNFGVLTGVQDVLNIYRNENVEIKGMKEGEIVFDEEPIMNLRMKLKDYINLGPLETPTIGELAQATGISSKAARVKIASKDKPVISFGSRRTFPEISKKVEKYAVEGGLDGFSNILAEEELDEESVGTMPHALIILNSEDDPNQIRAWKAFDEAVGEDVPRIALVDTYGDEKEEAIMAAENMENLDGVRLDTTGSRRGNFKQILEEVRWELNKRGYEAVKIFASGSLDEYSVKDLRDVVDAFGVGTSVSTAKPADPSYNIVEINGKPVAKRGKMGGEKTIYRTSEFEDYILGKDTKKPENTEEVFYNLMKNGEVLYKEHPKEIRKRVLETIDSMPKNLKSIEKSGKRRIRYKCR